MIPVQIQALSEQIIALETDLQEANTELSLDIAESEFKCGPAEGVPIHKWFPAVLCWLSNLLPIKLVYPDRDEDGNISLPDEFQDLDDSGTPDIYEGIFAPGAEVVVDIPAFMRPSTQHTFIATLQDSSGTTLASDNISSARLEVTSIDISMDEEDVTLTPDTYADHLPGAENWQAVVQRFVHIPEQATPVRRGIARIPVHSKL